MLRYGRYHEKLDRDHILSEQLWREHLHTGIKNFANARCMKPLCRQIGKSRGYLGLTKTDDGRRIWGRLCIHGKL